ncbi:FecR domain-containing protein [Prolixibacteraceae bacterium Z1-6]|uniref:FecR domain-containing protein n=1 Tax=Draconibacterium aestuarii TaxID=2998507 RepID=A0A9X3J7W1_9BACT|nr:FecR domain-containing protein [Prolixibacteraceae bacterium Z1-6]
MQNNSENNMTPEEFRKMNSEEKILKMASGLVLPKGKPQNEVLDSLLNKIEDSSPTRKINLSRYFQAAAAVIILLVAFKVVPNMLSAQQLKTANAQQAELTLPDGTEVVLNADSKIKWNKKKFNNARYLQLEGEAFFKVKKGDQFVIKTNNGTVEILGTQLNVFSRNEKFWVSCITGRVRVSANNMQQIITPGEWVQLNDSGLEKSESESIENTIMWKNGISHFEETQLDAIFAELERQFDVSIQFEGNGERKATIDFSNDDLTEALDVVCIPMELNYEIKNKKINISEKQ